MRVFELAKALKTTSADLLRQAQALKLDAHSPLARLDDDDVRALKAHFASKAPAGAAASSEETGGGVVASKRERAARRRDNAAAAELEALRAGVARARRIEAQRRGQPAAAAPETKPEAVAPETPATPSGTADDQGEAPVIIALEPPAADEAKIIIHAEIAEETAVAPADSEEAETPASAAARVKRLREAAEEEIDPDEALASAYLGKRVQTTSSSKAHPVRPKETREPEAPARSEKASATKGERAARPAAPAARARPGAQPAVAAAPAAGRAPARPAPAGRAPIVRASAAKTPTPGAPVRPRFAPVAPTAATADRVLSLRGPTLVKDLAEMMGVRPNRLIADLMQLNVLASINQRVDIEMAGRIAEKYGYKVELERVKRSATRKPAIRRLDAEDDIPDDRPEDLVARPPVVTFLGHVDHGKTSLMDRIRKTQVAEGEAGGITQHIGAYTVELNGRKITFLDTPGHAAFSAMRARGANLTDLAVIIIAADDGIMPQTREVIKQARQAEVQMLVAINKCDLPTAKPDRVRQQLQAEGLTPEEWGGDLVTCEVSATTGKGIDHLLEMILLQADMLELQANPNRRADGYVIEAQLELGLGPTATLLVSSGTLKVGDVVLIGEHFGRLRGLMDDRGRKVKTAGPAMAVRVMGLSGVPEAGAEFRAMVNEKRARELAEKFAQERKDAELSAASKPVTYDNLLDQLKAQKKKQLGLIVKADTQGSIEAIVDSLRDIRSEKIGLEIVNSAIGNVTNNDIQRAGASGATIVGFQIGLDGGVAAQARHDNVRVHTFRIIYELFDYVKQALLDMLDPEYREVIRGHAQIRAIFDIGKKGKVAGCQMLDGVLRTDARVRVKRARDVVFDGRMQTLHHFQDEVQEVRESQECGVRFLNFEGFAEGDVVECYVMEELERAL
ncbi:MAG: translation initiation factor IF-2 [Kiritimatiellae bacterium]|nr:translation initiation factor IF-2 [Kiritimatiellia bacterium]